MNVLEYLLRAAEKVVKKGIWETVHDLWIEKGMRKLMKKIY